MVSPGPDQLCEGVLLPHVCEGVVFGGVLVGPVQNRVGLAERAGTLPLQYEGVSHGHGVWISLYNDNSAKTLDGALNELGNSTN